MSAWEPYRIWSSADSALTRASDGEGGFSETLVGAGRKIWGAVVYHDDYIEFVVDRVEPAMIGDILKLDDGQYRLTGPVTRSQTVPRKSFRLERIERPLVPGGDAG